MELDAVKTYRYWVSFCVVAGAYVGTAKLGIHLSVAHGVITPVWAPTGIALAALLLGGLRLWPAVALGAFVGNATTGAAVDVAAVIAVGNTLEGVTGAYLLQRLRFRPSLDRARDVVGLVVAGALLSTTLAATNGVTTLSVAGAAAASPYGDAWRLWWLGDAMGALLVAPLILVWVARFPFRVDRRQVAEAGALLAAVAGVSAAVFLGGLWRYPYLLFPVLILATFRFKQVGTVTACFVAAVFAVAGVVGGETPIGSDPTAGVQILQSMLALVAVSLLILAAVLAERDAAGEGLAEAQALAHLGSWEWDISADRVSWSRELYRIYGLEPGAELTYDTFLSRVHPQDRDEVRSTIGQALAARSAFDFVHRIVLPAGGERTIHGRGRVVVGADGEPVRMVGTAQDVSERRRLEQVREHVLATISHEVRTPLTSILGFTFTLRERSDELDPAERGAIYRNLTSQALKLAQLLADLLDLERLRQGRLGLDVERTDLGRLVEEAAASVPLDGHVLETDCEPLDAEVDGGRVERMIENLVANAVKYTPPGTVIEVSVRRDGDGTAVIRVADGGPGIADEHKISIFELFERGTGAGSGIPGAGVGLAIVAQTAGLHGGRAWVEDREGGGSAFSVRLPLHGSSIRA